MRFEAAARSDVGLVRANNEDSWTASSTVLAVADGVGGRPAGEVASLVAVSVLESLVWGGVAVDAAVDAASGVVARLAAGNPLFTGMCCTLTAVALGDEGAVLAHVGDSKAVLVRDGAAEALTRPQTVTARLIREGQLAPEDEATHPKRATLYQVVGQAGPLDVDRQLLDLAPGDRLVLSTDGLDYAGADPVAALLAKPLPAADLADALVAAAIEGGGRDNITVVVADVVA